MQQFGRVVKTQYRSFLRQANIISSQNQTLWFQLPIGESDLQSFKYLPVDRDIVTLKAIFPTGLHGILTLINPTREVNGKSLKEIARISFRSLGNDKDFTKNITLAFEALRALSLQRKLTEVTSLTTTKGIRVACTAMYSPSEDAGDTQYPHWYFYRIMIENCSSDTIQILGRHWVFSAGDDFKIEVPKFSPGIVGEMPSIEPGQAFQYVSQVNLKYSSGTMEGTFLAMNKSTGRTFEIAVQLCQLQPIKFE